MKKWNVGGQPRHDENNDNVGEELEPDEGPARSQGGLGEEGKEVDWKAVIQRLQGDMQ